MFMYNLLYGLQVHYSGGAHPPLSNREALCQAGPALQTECKLHSSQTHSDLVSCHTREILVLYSYLESPKDVATVWSLEQQNNLL